MICWFVVLLLPSCYNPSKLNYSSDNYTISGDGLGASFLLVSHYKPLRSRKNKHILLRKEVSNDFSLSTQSFFVNEKKNLTPKFILKISKSETWKEEKENNSKLKRSLINFSRRLKRNFMLITWGFLRNNTEKYRSIIDGSHTQRDVSPLAVKVIIWWCFD